VANVDLTAAEVRHVAALARLGLDDGEVERLRGELAGILTHVAAISALPIADVPPTAHALAAGSPLRDDIARPGIPREEALRSAPDPTSDGFRVPPIGA